MDEKWREILEYLIWCQVKMEAKSQSALARGTEDEYALAEAKRVGGYAKRVRALRADILLYFEPDDYKQESLPF